MKFHKLFFFVLICLLVCAATLFLHAHNPANREAQRTLYGQGKPSQAFINYLHTDEALNTHPDLYRYFLNKNLLFAGLWGFIILVLLVSLSYKNNSFCLGRLDVRSASKNPLSLLIILSSALCIGAIATSYNGTIFFKAFLSYILVSFVMVLSLWKRGNTAFQRFQQLLTLLLRPRIACIITFAMGAYFFIGVFPLKDFNAIIFLDDFPSIYSHLVRGLEIMQRGALFGWEARVLGGIPTGFIINGNFCLLFAPFALLGVTVGFHLMIFSFFVFFPLLVWRFLQEVSPGGKMNTLILYAGLFINISFLKNIILCGMIDFYIGLNLFIIAAIFVQRLKRNKRWSLLGLLTALFFLTYNHIGLLLFAIGLLILEALVPARKVLWKKLILLALLLFSATLNYTYYLLRYAPYLKTNIFRYASKGAMVLQPQEKLRTALELVVRNMHIVPSYTYVGIGLITLPMLLYLLFKTPRAIKRFLIYGAGAFLLLCFASPTGIGLILSRLDYLLPFFLAVFFYCFLKEGLGQKQLAAIIFCSLIFLNLAPTEVKPIPHVRKFADYNQPLYEKIQSATGNMVLVENRWYTVPSPAEAPLYHAHFIPLLARQSNKKLFSSTGDGYTFSKFRGNCLHNGIFQGKPLYDIDPSEFNRTLKKWGIKYIVVWSNISKDYFVRYPQFYKKEWSDPEWALFSFVQAQPESIVIPENPQAQAALIHEDYLTKTVHLENVRSGDLIILKSNFFPEWQGYYHKKRIDLIEQDGQLAFHAPFAGEGKIILRYPKHTFFSFLIILSFLVCGIVEYRSMRRR